MAVLVKNVLVPADGFCALRDVLLKGGEIAEVGETLAADSTTQVVEYAPQTCLLLPGLHNAHSHSSNFFAKGGLAPLPLELMVACRHSLPPDHPWNDNSGALVERYRLAAVATGLHNLMSGATSVIDMLSLPEDDDLAWRCLAAAAAGYKESGCRCFLGPHFMDSADVHGHSGYAANFLALVDDGCCVAPGLKGLGPNGALRSNRAPFDPRKTARALAMWRRAITELHAPQDGLHIILAPHNELTCSPELFRGAVALMAEFPDVHATTHLLEGLHQPLGSAQKAEPRADGVSHSVRALDDYGFLTPRTTLAHCVHLSKADMRLIAKRGCAVSHNPISNLRLGAGIADVLAMRDAGVDIALGVDGAGSGVDSQDVLEAAKFACLLPNARTPEYRRWLKPRDVLLDMGSRCGRRAVGLGNGNSNLIAPGQPADVVLYDLTAFSLLPRADPFTTVLHSSGRPHAGGPQIARVYVNGRAVVVDGAPVNVDVERLRADLLAAVPAVYLPVDMPPDFASPYEVEYRAALGLALDPPAVVPTLDVSALVRELGVWPADADASFDAAPLSEEAQSSVSTLHGICRSGSGGFVAVGHGFESELAAALAASADFHGADSALKDRFAGLSFYSPPGAVKIAVRPTTLHERMTYPRVLCASDGIGRDPVQGGSIDGSPIDEADPFIFTEFPGLDAAMRAYQKQLRRLALALSRAMAIALGLPRRHFDDGWTRSNSGLTSLHYLPLRAGDAISTDGFTGQSKFLVDASDGDDPQIKSQFDTHDGIGDLGAALRAYPHADGDTLLTLLCHDVVDGLQVLLRGATTEDDRWVDVPRVAANQVVVQIGQMTQRWTNDEYKATPHRVLRPEAPAPSRTTISMFFRPGLATAIEVPPSLRRPNDAGDVYQTVSVKDFLTMPRTDEEGNPVKLTSNILKDGRWVGARVGSVCVPSVA